MVAIACCGEIFPTAASGGPGAMERFHGLTGDCQLRRGHVIPFGRSQAVGALCQPEERQTMSAMEACLSRLPICRSGSEPAWLGEVESCVAAAGAVSDRCLGAFFGERR